MKIAKLLKIWFLSVIFWWCIWLCQASDYEYSKIDIKADIKIDGTINIKENIVANFFTDKHWIYRDIPLNYVVDWKQFHIYINDINVEWKNFEKEYNNWITSIKIWDADITLIWKQEYPISYSTYWLIKNFSWMWYSELYWNFIWNEFDTNINEVHAEILLPKYYSRFSENDFLITTDWKYKTIDKFDWIVDFSQWDKIIISYDKELPAYQWITLAIKFPINYFEFDNERQSNLIWESDGENEYIRWELSSSKLWKLYKIIKSILERVLWLIFIGFVLLVCAYPILLLIIFLFPFWVFWVWKEWFKWIYNKIANWWINSIKWNKIIVQYSEPKWINCSECGLLSEQIALPRHYTCLFYDWAYKWYISIKQENKDSFKIIHEKDIDENVSKYELDFFKSLFKKEKTDSSSNKNYITIYNSTELSKNFKLEDLEQFWIKKNWFTKISSKKWFFSVSWAIIWFFLGFLTNLELNNILFVSLLIEWFSFWLFYSIIFSVFDEKLTKSIIKMPFTEKWATIWAEVLWYKKFIKACDEKQLKTFLKEDPLYFDKVLPFAVAFWLDTVFIQKITPLLSEMKIQPKWYNWDINNFYIVNNISQKSSTYEKPSYSSSSYSSSSGFSWWSSFSWWWSSFSRGWWWGWWWGRSW